MKAIQKTQSGFTLIELVVVIVILGILAATALPKFVDLGTDARLSVMSGVEGSATAAANMAYAKAAANNSSLTGAGSVTINGSAVTLNAGYPVAASIGSLMQLTGSVSEAAGLFTLRTNCTTQYVNGGGPPTYTRVVSGC